MLPFLTIIMQNESNTTLKKTSLKDMLTKISYMFHKKMKLPQVMQWQLIWMWEFPYLNTYDKNKERQQQELLGQSAVSNPSWVDFLLKRWCVFVLDDNLNVSYLCWISWGALYKSTLIFKQTRGFHGNGANSAIFLLLEAYGCHTVTFQGREHKMGIIPFNRYLFQFWLDDFYGLRQSVLPNNKIMNKKKVHKREKKTKPKKS